ncbi:MAG: hypothetical protein F6K45_13730 [Kamptonema sp. SIO1D9]|nr:hypothetical protein [Kamptonema sp. SIO1D9]
MDKLSSLTLLLTILTQLIFSPQIQPATAQTWLPVRGGKNYGISGIALLQQQENTSTFLVVHDNKKSGEPRLAYIITDGKSQPLYFPLNWQNNLELPQDLEAITALPNTDTFLAATSFGKIYHLRVDLTNNQVSILKVFDLPSLPERVNIEGFVVQEINDKLLAIWGHRGENSSPGVLYWGLLNLADYTINFQDSAPINAPFSLENVRHISDLKLDSAGILYLTAATDNGDDGTFDSLAYIGGVFDIQGEEITWRENKLLFPISRFPYHKIEALEIVPGELGGIIFATDDENMGSSIYSDW